MDEVDDSESKDNARTKNHENSCAQDVLPNSVCPTILNIEQATVHSDLTLRNGRLTPSRPHTVNSQDALRNGLSKLALRIWSSSRYKVVILSERSR
jgi:hypothetical protein